MKSEMNRMYRGHLSFVGIDQINAILFNIKFHMSGQEANDRIDKIYYENIHR